MTEPAKTELERCLATLDLYATGADAYCQVSQEAARLLREMADDFSAYAWHQNARKCPRNETDTDCACGLDAARARWRLQ